MNTRASGSKLANVGLLLMPLVAMGVLMAGCKSGGQKAAKTSTSSTSTSASAASSPAGKSPRETALADFLKSVNLEGRPVLIEFGMVGCELSDKGLVSMAELERAGAIGGLSFIRVEAPGDPAVADAYFKSKNPPFQIYKDKDSALAKALGATAFPTFVLADKFGHIRYTGKYPQEVVAWGKELVAQTQDPGSGVAPFGAKSIDAPKLLAESLPDLDGKQTLLSGCMGPGGLVIVFVDTACPYSALAIKEMPAVAAVLAGRKINAVVLNSDDGREKVAAFYGKNSPGVPVLYDTGAGTRERWNVQSVPIVAYVTPGGKVAYQGEAVWERLASAIEAAMGLQTGSVKFTSAGTSFG